MKRIKLHLDQLQVDSFATAPTDARTGTVRGHMPPYSMWTCPYVGCDTGGDTGTGGGDTDVGCGGGYLSADGGNDFTCAIDCFSHYTDCHRC